jgi:hypothetical protein
MDQTDLKYILDLLQETISTNNLEKVHDAIEFIEEYLADDGSPIELEE